MWAVAVAGTEAASSRGISPTYEYQGMLVHSSWIFTLHSHLLTCAHKAAVRAKFSGSSVLHAQRS